MTARRTVRAAGGVLWRETVGATGSGGVEVAVVHRPRYDDWSLPKGKLLPGEPELVGALREVAEETGFDAVPGRSLGQSNYRVVADGIALPKTVSWWSMQAGAGSFAPNHEVDELRWLRPGDAAGLLSAGRDVQALRLLGDRPATRTLLLLRHARAGDRRTWVGDDDLRPLDEAGRRQAAGLVALLACHRVSRVLSAPPVRCVDTVVPLASRLGLPVEVDAVFGDAGWEQDEDLAWERLHQLLDRPGTTVVSSQGGVVPGLVARACAAAGIDVEPRTRKGALWTLSFAADEPVLVDAHLTAPG